GCHRPVEDLPDHHLVTGGDQSVHHRQQPHRSPPHAPGIPIHRLRHLHPACRRGTGPPCRPLGRKRQDSMRTSLMTTVTSPATQTELSPHLKDLENESIHILREVAGQFDKIGLLFSGGKDSVVVYELARRAFAPATVPFELL